MPEVDFSVLATHDLPPAPNPLPAERSGRTRSVGGEHGTELHEQRGNEPTSDDGTYSQQVDCTVTENRAVWVDPNFLVLVQMTRTEGDESATAALESSAIALAERLAGVTSAQVHDVEQLQLIEADLLTILTARVTPAVIDVLHLDHNCVGFCASGMGRPGLRGRKPSPAKK